MDIISIIIGVIIGISIPIFFYWISYKSRINIKRSLDTQCADRKKELEQLNQEREQLSDEISYKTLVSNNLKLDIFKLETKKEILIQSLAEVEVQSQKTTEAIYEKNYEKMSQRLEQSANELSAQYRETEKSCNDEYLSLLADLSQSLGKEIKEQTDQLAFVKNTFKDWEAKLNAAVAENKRAAQELESREFYRINISQEDLNEIHKLQEIIPYLKDQEALNKVIWKVYYEKPTSDLVGRVIGQIKITGIYKITSLIDSKCYVGQAVDVASRWRQHIKRGLGAETPTRNKLYPAMKSIGVENFTFELIEQCEESQLDEREDFWQEYFHAKDFGYSIK